MWQTHKGKGKVIPVLFVIEYRVSVSVQQKATKNPIEVHEWQLKTQNIYLQLKQEDLLVHTFI
jgi:hypothetical protein